MDITRPDATAGPISRNFRPENVSAFMPGFFSSSFFASSLFSFLALSFLAAAAAATACFLSASLSCVFCCSAVCLKDMKQPSVRNETNVANDFMKVQSSRAKPKPICIQDSYLKKNSVEELRWERLVWEPRPSFAFYGKEGGDFDFLDFDVLS